MLELRVDLVVWRCHYMERGNRSGNGCCRRTFTQPLGSSRPRPAAVTLQGLPCCFLDVIGAVASVFAHAMAADLSIFVMMYLIFFWLVERRCKRYFHYK